MVLDGQAELPRLGERDVLEIVDQRPQVHDVLPEVAHGLRGIARQAVDNGLQPALQCRERRAQLVRDVVQQLLTQLVLALEIVCHRVEVAPELHDLPAAARLDPGGQLAVRQLPCGRAKRAERPHAASGNRPGHTQGQDADDHGRPDQTQVH